MGSPIPFPAQYESVEHCPAGCGFRIHIGDLIIRDDDLGYIHAECVPAFDRLSINPGETICPDCFCIRPCRCVDD